MSSVGSSVRSTVDAVRHTNVWQMNKERLIASSTTRSTGQGLREMQVMLAVGLARIDHETGLEVARIGSQDDMAFVGSATRLDQFWTFFGQPLEEAGHRLKSYTCEIRAPGHDLVADENMSCTEIPRTQQQTRDRLARPHDHWKQCGSWPANRTTMSASRQHG